MKNYAILLGVSEYQNAAGLPACKNDVEIMHRLIQSTQKYDIIVLDSCINKQQCLEQIDIFLPENTDDNEIGEILFYFSGHGYQDSEACFILNSTTLDKINSTSVKNSEVDAIIRKKNPKLFVKIIDACNSGLTYIKSLPVSTESLDITTLSEKRFENCVFMCSSKKDQTSLATKEYSLFTKSFVNAVIEASGKTIRYCDIQNYIADDFQSLGIEQTPYFITQNDGRDIFTEPTALLKELIESINTMIQASATDDFGRPTEIDQKIEEFLSRYRSLDSVKALIEVMDDIISTIVFPESWVKNYYEMEYLETGYPHEEESDIVKFLYEKRHSENLHVEIDTEKKSSQNVYFEIGSLFPQRPKKFTSKAYDLPTFRSIVFRPLQVGLPRYELSFVFVYSDTFLYFFTGSKQYIQKGWREFVEEDNTKYTYRRLNYYEMSRESWQNLVNVDIEKSVKFIETSLERFVAKT